MEAFVEVVEFSLPLGEGSNAHKSLQQRLLITFFTYQQHVEESRQGVQQLKLRWSHGLNSHDSQESSKAKGLFGRYDPEDEESSSSLSSLLPSEEGGTVPARSRLSSRSPRRSCFLKEACCCCEFFFFPLFLSFLIVLDWIRNVSSFGSICDASIVSVVFDMDVDCDGDEDPCCSRLWCSFMNLASKAQLASEYRLCSAALLGSRTRTAMVLFSSNPSSRHRFRTQRRRLFKEKYHGRPSSGSSGPTIT